MATIFDIAKITGYSAMTVSRVINEPEKVNSKTREIIEEIIKKEGYIPNIAAKSLANKCTNIIYVYIPADLESSHPFVAQAIAAMGERLGEYGYSFLLSRKPYTNESCDGVIATGLTLEEEVNIKEIIEKKPFVLFGNSKEFNSWVDVDNYQGSYIITEYMIKKGYKKIAYIGIDQHKRYAQERYNAFLDCMNKYNIPIESKKIVMVNNKELFGFEATNKLIDEGMVEAIICASDLLAIGCIRALNKRNISIPNEIAVSGFDGLGFEKISHPHITTIKQPISEVAIKLADMLVEKIKTGKEVNGGVYIEPSLIINESA